MTRILAARLALVSLLPLLAACGLADTAVTAAAGGVSKATEIQQARETQQRVVRQIEMATNAAAARTEAAATASE